MQRINKEIVEDNDAIRKEKGEYQIFYNEDELKSYDDIKNNFKNFKLDEDYELELKEDGWQSITYLKFFLHNEKEDIYLFLIKLEVSSMTDLEYELINLTTVEDELQKILDIRGKYSIKLKYDTDFYKFQRLIDDYDDEDEDEDEDELKIPPIIETGFASDNCIICCIEKPNILNLPCLHISNCEDCEKIGRFINCSICRKEIQRKVKI